MTNFRVTILGCGSAVPTIYHKPPSQIIEVGNKVFMIDCGEGTQIQMRKFRTKIGRLDAIFISHLHGDHIFGLPGLITTLSLLGRTADLNIYANKDLEILISSLTDYLGKNLTFKVNIIPLNPESCEVIFENKSIKVSSYPLKHRIETNGFLIEEKQQPKKIIKEMIDYYDIPVKMIKSIKDGEDFVTADGTVVDNKHLTTPSKAPRKYAYCSDTAYEPNIIKYIKGADFVYHEATFAESESERATSTMHSTASQAASIAKQAGVKRLVIGHYSSRYNELGVLLKEAQEVFPNTELASEGKVFDL